jgi:translation initiation factor 2 subunit 2
MSEFADPAAEDVPDEVAAMFDLSLKKKKKKSTKSKSDGAAEGDATKEAAAEGSASGEVASSSSGAGIFELDPPTYSYTQLLNRVVDSLQQNNPEITDKKRITMKPPQLMRGRTVSATYSAFHSNLTFRLEPIFLQWEPRRPCG